MSRRFFVPAVALVLTLSACGSSTTTSQVSAAGASGSTIVGGNTADVKGAAGGTVDQTTRRAAIQAFRDCLVANGVTLPQRQQPNQNAQGGTGGNSQPSFDPNGTPPPGFDPNGAPPQGGQGGQGGSGGFQLGGDTAPTGVDQTAYTKALAACKDKIPAGGFGRGNAGGGGRNNNPVYVACMKDNGINLPTPSTSTTTVAGATTSSTDATTTTSRPRIDRNSAAYKAANDKCKALLPANQQGGNQQPVNGSSTTTTGA